MPYEDWQHKIHRATMLGFLNYSERVIEHRCLMSWLLQAEAVVQAETAFLAAAVAAVASYILPIIRYRLALAIV
jgi:hypothetical protein